MASSDPKAAFDGLALEDIEPQIDPVTPESAPATAVAPPDPSPASPEPAPETASATPAAPSDPPSPPTPLVDPASLGEPLRFRVGPHELAPDGALITPDGKVILPKDFWENELTKNFLGDVRSWGQKEAGYRRSLQERDQRLRDADTKGTADKGELEFLRSFAQSIVSEQDIAKVAALVDGIRANYPTQVLQAQNRFLKEQLTQGQRETQVEEQRLDEDAFQQDLTRNLGWLVGEAMKRPELMVLEADGVEGLKTLLWNVNRRDVYRVVAPDEAQILIHEGWTVLDQQRKGLNGQVLMENRPAVLRLLEARAKPLQERDQRNKAAWEAEQRNKAQLAPTKPPVPATPPRPRSENGQFTKEPASRLDARRQFDRMTEADL